MKSAAIPSDSSRTKMSWSNTGSSDAVASITSGAQRGVTDSLGCALGGDGVSTTSVTGDADAETAGDGPGVAEHAATTAQTTASHTSHDFMALRRVGPFDRAGRNERSRILRA